jgi:DNA-3-methyladenine glycosylase II
MTEPRFLTKATLAAAVTDLTVRDPDLAAVVSRYGPPPMWARRPGYATLVWIILGQQVSQASAAAMYLRLSSSLGRITPHKVLGSSHTELRQFGLTRQKARYCRELAVALMNGTLDLPGLRHHPDGIVRQELTRVIGLGRWSADIYLLMALRRPDVWPQGDLALYKAFRSLKGQENTAEELDRLAEDWQPWRSVAARILWHEYISKRQQRHTDAPDSVPD